jgi:hypothetical protein
MPESTNDTLRNRDASCSDPRCRAVATANCQFALDGPKRGRRCDRPVCVSHEVVGETGRVLCCPHAKREGRL